MGIGVLYGRKELLEEMIPYQGGGEMIKEVSFAKTTYNVAPYRFEAGTPSVADVIGFGKAIEYINNHQLVFELSSKKQIAYWFDMFYKELLEILKGVDKE